MGAFLIIVNCVCVTPFQLFFEASQTLFVSNLILFFCSIIFNILEIESLPHGTFYVIKVGTVHFTVWSYTLQSSVLY